ncbi:unnamed protein product [Pleuronectes platessa]|uniref:Uncharacterized protein n=1 Tax=Pleuronectes platessa TaxID=8262 RepID=A0A9N7VF52_PLEPL|nr:unnamed protein product [Pleuronectes platessa]
MIHHHYPRSKIQDPQSTIAISDSRSAIMIPNVTTVAALDLQRIKHIDCEEEVKVSMSRKGDRASGYQAPLPWNQFPISDQEVPKSTSTLLVPVFQSLDSEVLSKKRLLTDWLQNIVEPEIMCLCVWLRRFLVLPGTTLPFEQPKYLTWARKGGGALFTALLPPVRPGEPPLSLVILARCLAGNQPSGPLREEGGGDVSLLGMRPLYFSDIQQEQHSHHL